MRLATSRRGLKLIIRGMGLAALVLLGTAGAVHADETLGGDDSVALAISGVEATADPVTEPDQTAVARVIQAIEPDANVMEPVQPVAGAVEPVVEPVVDAPELVEPVVELAEPALAPVVDLVEPAVEPVLELVEPALAPVVGPVIETAEPVVDLVEPVRPIREIVVPAIVPTLEAPEPVVGLIVDTVTPGPPPAANRMLLHPLARAIPLTDTVIPVPAEEAHLVTSRPVVPEAPDNRPPVGLPAPGTWAGVAQFASAAMALLGAGLLAMLVGEIWRLWSLAFIPRGLSLLPLVPPA